MTKSTKSRKWARELGLAAMVAGWPYALHDDRFKRDGEPDPDDEDGFWRHWPDFRDDVTERQLIAWLEDLCTKRWWENTANPQWPGCEVNVCWNKEKGVQVICRGAFHVYFNSEWRTTLAEGALDCVFAAIEEPSD